MNGWLNTRYGYLTMQARLTRGWVQLSCSACGLPTNCLRAPGTATIPVFHAICRTAA